MEAKAVAPKPEIAPTAPKRGKKPFLILGGMIAVFAAATGIYLLATANQESTDDAQVEADVVPIAARASGQIAKRLVEDNQRVKKGDVLIQIDDADFAARVKQAEAELNTARAQAAAADAQVQVVEASAKGGLQTARASFSGSSMGVANAEAQLAAARAGLERSKADLMPRCRSSRPAPKADCKPRVRASPDRRWAWPMPRHNWRPRAPDLNGPRPI